MAFSKVSEGGFVLSGAAGTKNQDFSTVTGADPIQNDIVIVVAASDSGMNDPLILTSGYSDFGGPSNSAGLGPGHAVYGKRMGATPDTSVDLDHGGGTLAAGLIQIWRGVDTTTALDGTTTRTSGASGMPDAPSHTTSTNGSLVFAVGMLDDDDVASSVTAPSGYTNLFANDTGQASTSVGATVMIASKELATAGAENPAAFGGSGSDAWFAHTFSLKLGAGGGSTVPIGLTSETDTAFAVGRLKTRAVGLASESDTAFAVGRLKSREIGLTTETDEGLAVGRLKTRAIGLATETDTAHPFVMNLVVPVGLAEETDTALAISRLKARTIGLATEADAALGAAPAKVRAIGLAEETDTAGQIGTTTIVDLGLATEIDSAFAVTRRKTRALGLAIEIDSAPQMAEQRRHPMLLEPESYFNRTPPDREFFD